MAGLQAANDRSIRVSGADAASDLRVHRYLVDGTGQAGDATQTAGLDQVRRDRRRDSKHSAGLGAGNDPARWRRPSEIDDEPRYRRRERNQNRRRFHRSRRRHGASFLAKTKKKERNKLIYIIISKRN